MAKLSRYNHEKHYQRGDQMVLPLFKLPQERHIASKSPLGFHNHHISVCKVKSKTFY